MKSCVSLLSAVCGQPDDVMERWLDLYYQVRRAQEKADAAARAAERLREVEPFIIPGTLEAVPSQAAAEAAETRATARVAPTAKDEAADAENGEAKAEPEPLRENRIKRQGGKGKPRPWQVGNTRCHDAAVFKRQVRDRLKAVRKKGVSAPEIVRAATTPGAFTDSNVYDILDGKALKIEIYRALDKALRHFEK